MRYFFLLLLITFLCTSGRAQLEITAKLGLVANQCTGSTPDPNNECTALSKESNALTYPQGTDSDLFFTYQISNKSGKIIRRVQVSDSHFGEFFPEQKVNIPNGAIVPLNIVYGALKSPETIYGTVSLTVEYGNGSNEQVTGTYTLKATPTVAEVANPDFNTPSFAEELSVYPNPAMDLLTLKGFAGGPVSVVDVRGRTILHTTLPPSGSLNVAGFTTGVYLLRTSKESVRWLKQ